MFYLTPEECVEFCSDNSWSLSDENWPLIPPLGFTRISFMVPPEREQLAGFCRMLMNLLPFGANEGWLLWPVNYQGNSAANYHLYYKLRQAYSDHRQLSQAPGHLFLEHEENDLLTFMQLAFLFGWDFHLVCAEWGALHNDECVVLYSPECDLFGKAKEALTQCGINWRSGG